MDRLHQMFIIDLILCRSVFASIDVLVYFLFLFHFYVVYLFHFYDLWSVESNSSIQCAFMIFHRTYLMHIDRTFVVFPLFFKLLYMYIMIEVKLFNNLVTNSFTPRSITDHYYGSVQLCTVKLVGRTRQGFVYKAIFISETE